MDQRNKDKPADNVAGHTGSGPSLDAETVRGPRPASGTDRGSGISDRGHMAGTTPRDEGAESTSGDAGGMRMTPDILRGRDRSEP